MEKNEMISSGLESPSEQYKESYLEALKEFQSEGRHLDESREELERDFGAMVEKIGGYPSGRNLPEGYVPCTLWWLIDGGEYIGTLTVRHQLNDHLLRVGGHIGYEIRPSKRGRGYGTKIMELSLSKAKELGLSKVLLTCDSTNTASRKIIEGAGGVLENEVPAEGGGPAKLRFWIEIK